MADITWYEIHTMVISSKYVGHYGNTFNYLHMHKFAFPGIFCYTIYGTANCNNLHEINYIITLCNIVFLAIFNLY